MTTEGELPILSKKGVRADVAVALVVGFWVAAFVALLLFSGCAYEVCQTPEQRAARHGIVLECHERLNGKRVVCLVNTSEGDQVFNFPNHVVCH
jgi:hypothetical protein